MYTAILYAWWACLTILAPLAKVTGNMGLQVHEKKTFVSYVPYVAMIKNVVLVVIRGRLQLNLQEILIILIYFRDFPKRRKEYVDGNGLAMMGKSYSEMISVSH